MVFGGSAGTGKTYTGVAMAVALKEKQVKRIILTRPAVEAGRIWVSYLRYERKT
jgi:phosphate starvation-inducible PhoH-like protein